MSAKFNTIVRIIVWILMGVSSVDAPKGILEVELRNEAAAIVPKGSMLMDYYVMVVVFVWNRIFTNL